MLDCDSTKHTSDLALVIFLEQIIRLVIRDVVASAKVFRQSAGCIALESASSLSLSRQIIRILNVDEDFRIVKVKLDSARNLGRRVLRLIERDIGLVEDKGIGRERVKCLAFLSII